GCSHGCSFCTIPSIRGPFRSREMESLILESEMMVDRGVKEINLIAQDTTMYGRDLSSGACLEDLLEKLVRINGLNWIRILYAYPSGITNRLLEIMESESSICPYLDLPLQHINEDILNSMGRNFKTKDAFQLIDRLRSGKRRLSLRTTFMVGFPGETDDSFKELYDFIKLVEFDYLGVFIYCPEKGTRAERMERRTEIEISKKRIDLIMELQKEISRRKNQRLVNKVVPVLIEGVSSETDLLLTGRTSRMAPEVDGQVLINRGNGLVGKIHRVLINEAYSYDLIGEIISGDNTEKTA
ncbi:MAG: MiaB/RimO family radical SAM methylthiotransferase, partial [Deltaproteobacteria bacterium]|nr:MiaB/RimO family radical SAM methylthiotransferase [Deltaproteobacteria bacterium]